ncbi:hypothetical protein VRRI112168_02600 [Vreelandella rituensis]|uniref:Outer membrane protein beta-barrel domain-containing protein n=1 Tax=Vreelandella rituensis TaxID=2282306 RepID=A0A368U9M5_9GAMM|nr:hypothetical protein [Halomonas rituensis]RCV93634.1 hypothetical protein DU506_00320 [Halomonas rituensis]
MKKTLIAASVAAALMLVATGAQAFEDKVSVGAVGGTTGVGADVSWRFHKNFGVTARYTGGFSFDTDYDTDEAVYDADLDISVGSLHFNLHPFGGGFYLAAGAAFPDIESNATGTPKAGAEYDFNGQRYSAADVGSLNGQITIADGVQPYFGMGWRSTHTNGFELFSEVGVFPTSIDVALSTSNNYEGQNAEFYEDLRQEERNLKDDADAFSVYPVWMIGVSYTF